MNPASLPHWLQRNLTRIVAAVLERMSPRKERATVKTEVSQAVGIAS